MSGVICAAERIEATSNAGGWPHVAIAVSALIAMYFSMFRTYPFKQLIVGRSLANLIDDQYVQRSFAGIELKAHLLQGVEK